MTGSELKHLYFEWMYRLVCDDRYQDSGRGTYRKIIGLLFDEPYRYFDKPLHDEERAYDGLDLRYRFAYENGIPQSFVASQLDITPCSMLEMMIGVAYRCESIAADISEGDRVGQWFWEMLGSLGLAKMNDANFDREEALWILDKFARNDYEPNGYGGLFTIADPCYDARDKEIYWLMCQFLTEHDI